jgi:hypothetical protein
MNQLLLLLWLDQQSREAHILRCGASQDWEIRTEPVPFSEDGSCLFSSIYFNNLVVGSRRSPVLQPTVGFAFKISDKAERSKNRLWRWP